jgi:two-component system sensor kinase FixL
MAKKKQDKIKRKPQTIKKKTKADARRKMIRDTEKVSFKERISALSVESNHLKRDIKQKSKQLKIKNGQLKKGQNKQQKTEEQVNICTKAMDSTIDGIFIIDVQKRNFPVVYANHAFQIITGYKRREILGRNYFSLYETGADSHITNEIKYAINKGRTFHGKIVSFKKKGKEYWNLLRIAPVRDPEGKTTHYVGIQTDITMLRANELKIVEQREELLHVTRVGKLAEFVSSLAHEISQPLTSILSYAQAAQRMLNGRKPKLKKILQYIINDDQRAVAVIQRMRLLLKKDVSEMKQLDINSVINDVIILIATDAAVRRDILKLDLEKDLPFIYGDHIQLQQVILNLISNSFDALDNGQQVREIMIRTSRNDSSTIMVEVMDTGCGIPVKNLPKLFTRFFTSKQDGLGMGLSISRAIVELHGGKLYVKNNPEGGATFYFTLPIGKRDKA